MKTRIKDVMTPNPIFVEPTRTIQEAAQLMKDNNCGVLPVGIPEKIMGMLTDRDITVRAVAAGLEPHCTHVDAIMSEKVYSCEREDDLWTAAERMRKHDVSRLMVSDGRKYVGIVTLADLIRTTGNEQLSDKVLHELLYAD